MAKKKIVKKTNKKPTSKKTSSKKTKPKTLLDKAKDKLNIKKKDKKEKINFKEYFTFHKIMSFLLGLAIIILTIGIIFVTYVVLTAPDFNKDLLYNQESTILLDKNGEEFAKLGAENREIVYFDELPQSLVDAIVATEDSRYFQHNGFDLGRFTVAGIQQLFGNSAAGGASTLTMQLSKQRFTSNIATGLDGIVRKFQDIYLSIFKIEKDYTKEEIFEFYVNYPWLGPNNSWGVEAASQTYFGKSVRDLTLSESALIAGLFNLPTTYSPYNNLDLATERRNTVLNLMVRHGYITEEQANDAKAISVESLILPEEERTSGTHEYQSYIDTVVMEVQEDTGANPNNTPMIIQTTLDPEIQDVLVALDNEEFYEFKDDVVQTAVAITNVEDGSISAILGRRNQTGELQNNLATNLNAHPGSTAKPLFDYGPFIEYNGGSTYTQFFDEQYSYSNGTSIKNNSGTYVGQVTMREALKRSMNIPALQAFQQVETEDIHNFVTSLGIDYGSSLYESASLGAFEGVSPLEMASSYAAFASGGIYTEPYSYTKITFINTDEVVEKKPESTRAMSEETAYMMNSMLMSATANGAAGTIRVSGTNVASKSGTSTYDYDALIAAGLTSYQASNSSRDNWVNVYSPDYSISVWYGYEKLSKEYFTYALDANTQRIKITAGVANRVFPTNSKFDVPSGVVEVDVELETFPPQLPSANTPADMIETELFIKGTEPDQVSSRYNNLANPTNVNSSIVANTVSITWDPIPTPNSIDSTYLLEHFNTYYQMGDFDYSTKYYNKRIEYNNANIGTVKYEIYLKSGTELIKQGETQSTSFNTTCLTNDCIYVIKSNYTIFNAASSGVETEVKSTTKDNVEATFNTGKNVCLESTTGTFDLSKELIIKNNGNIVTSDASITFTITLDNTPTSMINLTIPGVYKINYSIVYNQLSYKVDQTINICENGCNADKTCKIPSP